jgi:hypothetical protein
LQNALHRLLLLLLQGLPLSVTHLVLEWCGKDVGMVSSSTAPSLAQRTALKHLQLHGSYSSICPSILQRMQQLQHLDMSDIAPDGLQILLDALQNMQQLQHLSLHAPGLINTLQGEELLRYSQLTASTQLTHLDLLYDECILVDGAARYMFSEGKQLPHLKVLQFGPEDWDGSDFPLPFGPGDLARLAAACPALEQLWAEPAIQPSADIAELALLTSVTQLWVGGWDLNAQELSLALAKMSQLVDLQVEFVDGFGTLELAALTQLTGLRRLLVQAPENQKLLLDHCHPHRVSLYSRVRPHDIRRMSPKLSVV